jgi:hypothetical protein
MSKKVVKALNALRDRAAQCEPAAVEEYRALWAYLWNDRRAALGVSCKCMEDVRALVLGFLADGVPVDTTKMVALEFMKGVGKP